MTARSVEEIKGRQGRGAVTWLRICEEALKAEYQNGRWKMRRRTASVVTSARLRFLFRARGARAVCVA